MNEPRSVYMPLDGRVAVVSGGGKGLGRSFCLALARQGAKVVVNNHNPEADAAGQVVAEIAAMGSEAVADYGDAADPGSGQAMVAAALERWGRLDICVANAAIGTAGMFHKQPAAEFSAVVDVNLLGSARLARAAMAVMRPAGFGRIILVASAGGLHGDVGLSAYAASKGGMLALGRTLAAEGEARGVLTNVLLPYALTQMTEGVHAAGRGPADGPGPGGAGAHRAGQPGLPAQRRIRHHRRRPAATGLGGGVGHGLPTERAGSSPGSAARIAGRERLGQAA